MPGPTPGTKMTSADRLRITVRPSSAPAPVNDATRFSQRGQRQHKAGAQGSLLLAKAFKNAQEQSAANSTRTARTQPSRLSSNGSSELHTALAESQRATGGGSRLAANARNRKQRSTAAATAAEAAAGAANGGAHTAAAADFQGRSRRNRPLTASGEDNSRGAGRGRASSSASGVVRPRSSGQVRSQYLANLGIDQPKRGLTQLPSQAGNSGSALDHATPPTLQTLSGSPPMWWRRAFSPEHGNGTRPSSSAPARSQLAGGQQPKKVVFNDMVEVRYVPLHSEYSQRIRQKYWASAQELWDMATRNTIEFAAEGYDWRLAVEEQDLVRLGSQLVHPVHLQNQQQQQLQQHQGYR